jgi:DNA-directed RNA polymerase II subunit RPB2
MNSSELSNDDFIKIVLNKVINPQTRYRTQIDSFNHFIDNLPSTIENEFAQERKEVFAKHPSGISSVEYGIVFENIIIMKPTEVYRGQSKPQYPNQVLQSNRTYKSSVYANIRLWHIRNRIGPDGKSIPDAKKEVILPEKVIGSVPIMVKSKECVLYNMPASAQIELNEDPSDPGGYFIIDGLKKVMLIKKNTVKNVPQLCFIPSENSITCKYSSQPGDIYAKSTFVKIDLIANQHLLFSVSLGKDLNMVVPFFAIYYMFNVVSDKDIFDTILPDFDPVNKKHIMMAALFRMNMTIPYGALKKNLSGMYRLAEFDGLDAKDPDYLIFLLAAVINANDTAMNARNYLMDTEENRTQTSNDIYNMLDNKILVHIGSTSESRVKKLNFLGSLVREIYEVSLGKAATDRNSIENNAMHNPSPGLMTALKTIFNITVAQNIVKAIADAIKKDPSDFNMGTIFEQTINPDKMGKIISKTLKAGNKKKIKVGRKSTINSRIHTLQHSPISVMGANYFLNAITNDVNLMSSQSNEASMRFRGSHASTSGLICPWHTVEGPKAGLSGQMTPCAEITESTYSEPIFEIMIKDVENYNKMNEEGGGFYSQVIINGNPIGSHFDTRLLARKYRCYRRANLIDRQATIYYAPLNRGELSIQTHLGRMCRLMFVVYRRPINANESKYCTWPLLPVNASGVEYTMDNLPESDKKILGDNKQYIRFTKKMSREYLAGKITVDHLIAEGVIEWVGAGEYKNIIAANDFHHFMNKRNEPTEQYTHLDIPWQKVCLSILTAPFGNRSQPVRTAYQSKFTKQVCGPPPLNLHCSFPMKLPVTYNTYQPIASTITDKIMPPGGAPVIIAIMCYADNQEDSLIASQSFVQRAKMTLNTYSTKVVELDTSQEFRNPDAECAKSNDYSHLINGIPAKGTVIHKGMAVVGIVETVKGRDGNPSTRVDKSFYHQGDNPIIIDGTIKKYKEESTPICKIRYYSVRPVEPGDKFGARSGGKGVISKIVPDCMMPVTACGVVPEMILNLCSVPKRMIVNQILEGTLSYICSHYGVTADATMFRSYDEVKYDDMAERAGIDKDGTQIMYEGVTGKQLRARIYVNTNHYQRLDKMATDSCGISDNPHIDIKTNQPYKSIQKDGGIRSGYMENDVIESRGCAGVLGDLLFNDSDGKVVHICDNCKGIAAVNFEQKKYSCKNKKCDGGSTFTRIDTCQGTIAFVHNLAAFGIKTELIPEPPMI